MYPLGWEEEFSRERIADARAAAEERRLVRPASLSRPTMRARISRKLFQAAVAVEREEAWRTVWERLEAPRHS